MEGKIHKDMFSLFFSIWSNPDSKIFKIVKYLLETSSENSRTWSIHLRHMAKLYGIDDPLDLLKCDTPLKSSFKELVTTKITSYYEKLLRQLARNNSKLGFLNVSVSGLRGRHHPALSGVTTTHSVRQSRVHIKMLSGDYFCYSVKARQQPGVSPHCRLCDNPNDNLEHILTRCSATGPQRKKILTEIVVTAQLAKNNIQIDSILGDNNKLSQFILDPTSMNLDNNCRINICDPIVPALFKVCRDFCFSVHSERTRKLKLLTAT